MANIIHVENKHKTGLKNKKVKIITLLLIVMVGAGGYAAYKYYSQAGTDTPSTANQDTLTVLRKAFDETKQAALDNPEDADKQAALSDAKSALADEYVANNDYTSAKAILNDGATSLQSMQAEAILAEQQGDYPAAITALKQQIDYYKALPATDTNYDMHIDAAERKIAQLQEGL